MRTVSQVARMSGVTVRTLHHYDEIGLLRPSQRSAAGYRLYDSDDIARLQEILFFRELGVPLDEIKPVLEDPDHDRGEVLRRQRDALLEQAIRLEALLDAVQAAIDAHDEGRTMTDEEMLEVFGDFDPKALEEEARQRWGQANPEAFAQASRRTRRYRKEDWVRIKAEHQATAEALAALHAEGVAPDSAEAMALAEEHRQHITRWYYDCSYEIHRGLGELYVADPRFTATYDGFAPDREPGTFVAWLRDAIHANAAAHGA